ncbi:hypothetical protein BJ138DRAFT_1121734 [Hygrophoropsis aurantiaca]|uniref:Uncharacterized protein n=1 Tax=Hygrophoropsis aurantiaca TaxID=72124 RepID=A0ACB8ATE8_9AGAM|nr:hypothetical protein BJ138DRAFT_1121734 [Hygrophoropsis aurantiaca]
MPPQDREYEGSSGCCSGETSGGSCSDPCAAADTGTNDWGTLQIATPIIVGGVLIALFSFYLIWRRRSESSQRRSYPLYKESIFATLRKKIGPRRTRYSLKRSSDPMTLDDSLDTPLPEHNFRRSHHLVRSESTDSTTPLTSSPSTFEYPPSPPTRHLLDPLAPPKQRRWRWWFAFHIGPQEVKPKEVDRRRFRIDGPDSSCTSHRSPTDVGHGSMEAEEDETDDASKWTTALGPVHETLEDEDSVLLIGNDRSTVHSTSMYPGAVQREVNNITPPSTTRSAAPEYTYDTTQVTQNTTTTQTTIQPIAPAPRHPKRGWIPAPPPPPPAPPVYSAHIEPPPALMRNLSVASSIRPLPSPPSHPTTFTSMRTQNSHSNHTMYQHERQLSTESMLNSQLPMSIPSSF